MPSSSDKQHRLMEMVAHDPKAAKRVGVPQSVGRDFAKADAGKRFSDGGRAGGTPDYKVLREEADHMIVDDGSGRPFKVPTAMLAHRTVQRIRRYASGGEVKPTDDGQADLVTRDPRPDALDLLPGSGMNQSVQPPTPYVPMVAPEGPLDSGVPVQSTNSGGSGSHLLVTPPSSFTAAAAELPASGSPMTAPLAPGEAPLAGAALENGTPGDGGAARRAGIAGNAMMSVAEQQRLGLGNIADTEKAQAAAAQSSLDRTQAMMKAKNAELESEFQRLSDPKNGIKPGAWWDNRSTGQKIVAGIGAFLGGMKQGFIGGNNPALDIIHDAIERDVDSQKANLANRNSLLGKKIALFGDNLAAEHDYRADSYNAAAAQVASQQARMGSATSLPTAIAAVQALKQKAAMEGQESAIRSQQIQSNAMNLTMTKARFALLNRLRLSSDPNDQAAIGKEIEYMDKPGQRGSEQVNIPMQVPTGAKDSAGNPLMKTTLVPHYGRSPEAANEAAKALMRQRRLESDMNIIEQFARKNPLGGEPGSSEVGEAQSALTDFQQNFEGSMANMNRPPSPEVADQVKVITQDPTAFWKSNRYKGALKFMRQATNEHGQSIRDAYTIGPHLGYR